MEKYIKGTLRAKYKGTSDGLPTGMFNVSKVRRIELTACAVEYAVWTEAYQSEDREDTFDQPFLSNVTLRAASEELDLPTETALVDVWITNIELHNVVTSGSNSFGELTGVLYGTIADHQRLTTQRTIEKDTQIPLTEGCWAWFRNLLLIVGLFNVLLLLWCLLFGHCSWNGLLYGCPDCAPTRTQRDTVFVYRDSTTQKKQGDSLATQTLGTGDLQFSLFWNSQEDLDLMVRTPNDNVVYFSQKKADLGTMDLDMNATSISPHPTENIFWKKGNVPPGTYTVYVVYYKRRKETYLPEPFSVRIKNKEQVQTIEQSILDDYINYGNGSFAPSELEDLPRYAVKIAEVEVK
ncbi:MAG: hypothetical protein RLZZ292_152 [Bacteroidota bacterium]